LRIGIRATLLLLVAAIVPAALSAQGHPTADRSVQLYAFGGMTENYTGLEGGKNIGVTAGIDLGFGSYRGFLPTLEARGVYPFDSGTIVGEKSGLGGLKAERRYGNFHPYGDFLFGRGQMAYAGAGFLNPSQTIIYQRTNSNILSFGGGVDFDVTPSLAIKADVQYQHWDNTPVTASGSLYAKPITVGVLYRFGYRQRHPY
jgi:opacity protein-like surface antigen